MENEGKWVLDHEEIIKQLKHMDKEFYFLRFNAKNNGIDIRNYALSLIREFSLIVDEDSSREDAIALLISAFTIFNEQKQ